MTGFDERFTAPALDPKVWIDHYLPHWTTPERSAARYDLDATGEGSGLVLRIDADQPAWRDEDGRMRVSSLQTAAFSGPVGSGTGTHRHVPDLLVRTETPLRRLWTPAGSGRVDAWLQASPDPTCMLAVWLVGVEDGAPGDSGEITIAELFGSTVGRERSTVRLGVKAINDPRLSTEVVDVELDIDAAAAPHRYAAEWDGTGIRFFVDDELVHSSVQRLDYPLMLLVDLFEFPESDERTAGDYPKTARVQRVTGETPLRPRRAPRGRSARRAR